MERDGDSDGNGNKDGDGGRVVEIEEIMVQTDEGEAGREAKREAFVSNHEDETTRSRLSTDTVGGSNEDSPHNSKST